MPKMFVHAPRGLYDAEARAQIAAELTDLGMACERLAHTDAIRAGVWVFFAEHDPGFVFSGGKAAERPIVALLVNAIEGGLDQPSRTRMIAEATAILTRHAARADVGVYVPISEIPETRWGMYGKTVNLAAMRAPA